MLRSKLIHVNKMDQRYLTHEIYEADHLEIDWYMEFR